MVKRSKKQIDNILKNLMLSGPYYSIANKDIIVAALEHGLSMRIVRLLNNPAFQFIQAHYLRMCFSRFDTDTVMLFAKPEICHHRIWDYYIFLCGTITMQNTQQIKFECIEQLDAIIGLQ